MDPDAAADLLGELTEERSRTRFSRRWSRRSGSEVTQLLEFGEHTAAGRMTTEFIVGRRKPRSSTMRSKR